MCFSIKEEWTWANILNFPQKILLDFGAQLMMVGVNQHLWILT
jgi:hypothetical protein